MPSYAAHYHPRCKERTAMDDELLEEFSYPTMFGEAQVFTLETDDEDEREDANADAERHGESGGADDARIEDDDSEGRESTGAEQHSKPIRVLYVGGGFQSASYLGDARFEPVFEYYRAFDHMFESARPINHALMIGAGAYSYPKHLLTSRNDTTIDVVEIDSAIVEIARKHFYVDELEQRYGENGTEQAGRLRTIVEDGVTFLAHAQSAAYDAIINDSFDGTNPTGLLLTPESIRQAKRCLTPGGLYLLNAVVDDECEEHEELDECEKAGNTGTESTLEHEESRRANSNIVDAAMRALSEHFAFVYEIPCIDLEFSGADNYLVIATDEPCAFTGVQSALCS